MSSEIKVGVWKKVIMSETEVKVIRYRSNTYRVRLPGLDRLVPGASLEEALKNGIEILAMMKNGGAGQVEAKLDKLSVRTRKSGSPELQALVDGLALNSDYDTSYDVKAA